MKKTKEVKISYLAAHLTTIVSVTLLLLLVGAIGILGVAARNAARQIREQQQVNIVMADSVSDGMAQAVSRRIASRPFALDCRVVTKAEALADWNEQTGEDLEAVAGYNFLSPEIEFRLKEEYGSAQQLKKVEKELKALPGVAEVIPPDPQTVSGMNSFFGHAFLVLGITALVMILISFVLINNTVLLTIYSRRFTIHTMQLVGATDGFIRRPFIRNNLLSALIAATLASGIIAAVLYLLKENEFPELFTYVDTAGILIVVGALYICGLLVCGLSAWISTTRFLRRDYDDLFR